MLPGCAWLKAQTASKPSKVPTDPERRQIAEAKTGAGKKVAADSDSATAVSATADSNPVKLDGSATGNGAPATPNAPGLASLQIPASGLAPDDPSAGLPDSFGKQDGGGNGSGPGSRKGSVVGAGSRSDSTSQKRRIVTADDRGEDGRFRDDSGWGRSRGTIGPLMTAAESTNRNSRKQTKR